MNELDAIALISETARNIETLPAIVLALILINGRTGLRIACVADAVAVEIRLIRCQAAIVGRARNTVIVVVRIADIAGAGEIAVELIGIGVQPIAPMPRTGSVIAQQLPTACWHRT